MQLLWTSITVFFLHSSLVFFEARTSAGPVLFNCLHVVLLKVQSSSRMRSIGTPIIIEGGQML